MKNINKILAVSLVAMLAVPAAHAKIVSETMLGTAGHYSGSHTVQSEIDAKQATLVTDGANKNIQGAGGITVSKSGDVITITGTTYDDTSLAGRVTTAEGEIDALQGTVGDNTSGLVKDVADLQNVTSGLGDLATKDEVAESDLASALANKINGKVDANSAITGATKTKITYDSKGLVTAGADLEASDIPTLTLSKISDAGAAAAKGVDTSMTASSNSTDVPTTAAVASFVSGYAAAGAEVNVQADWNQTTTTADDYIKNKPTLGALASKDSVAKTDLATALANEIDGKANSATTLAGYGITDAYTTTAADNKFQTKDNIATSTSWSTDKGSDTKYASAKAVDAAIAAAGGQTAEQVATAINTKVGTLDGVVSGSGNVAKTVTEADGIVTTTLGNVFDKIGTATGSGNVITAISKNADNQTIDVVKGITALQQSDVAQTYSGTGTAPVSGAAVKQAIDSAASNYEIVDNKVSSGDYNDYVASETKYPSMAVADDMIGRATLGLQTEIGTKIDTTITGDAATVNANKNVVMVRNDTATYVPGKGNAITVADDGTITVNEATKATKDGSGNTITSTYATKTEVTNVSNTVAGLDLTDLQSTGSGNVVTSVTQTDGQIAVAKNIKAIPEPTVTDETGTLVLTAKAASGGGYEFRWEDLGR